jgi:hypothetical protein
VIVDFYKMEDVRLNRACHFISLFAMKERENKKRKNILSFIVFFSCYFRVLPLVYFPVRVVGTCETYNRYY